MNKNTKFKRSQTKGQRQTRLSRVPKVGYPNKPNDLRGPTLREQAEMFHGPNLKTA